MKERTYFKSDIPFESIKSKDYLSEMLSMKHQLYIRSGITSLIVLIFGLILPIGKGKVRVVRNVLNIT